MTRLDAVDFVALCGPPEVDVTLVLRDEEDFAVVGEALEELVLPVKVVEDENRSFGEDDFNELLLLWLTEDEELEEVE